MCDVRITDTSNKIHGKCSAWKAVASQTMMKSEKLPSVFVFRLKVTNLYFDLSVYVCVCVSQEKVACARLNMEAVRGGKDDSNVETAL